MIKKGKTSTENIFFIMTILFVGISSIIVLPYYINGDQSHYRNLYSGLEGLPLFDGFVFYKLTIGSEEPVYFLFSWMLSNLGIEKDVFITIANILLAVVGYKTLLKLGSKPYVSYIIVSFNFYFLVFYLSAERLKFALIFSFLFYIADRLKPLYALLSILSHSQIIIIYFSVMAPNLKQFLYDIFVRFKFKNKYLLIMIIAIVASPIVFVILGNHISSKISYYYTSENTIIDFLRIFAFFTLSFFYAKKKIDTIFAFLPLFVLVFFLGGERINFIGYFMFLYFSVHYRGGFNFGIIITNIYFTVTSYFFIKDVIEFGTGF